MLDAANIPIVGMRDQASARKLCLWAPACFLFGSPCFQTMKCHTVQAVLGITSSIPQKDVFIATKSYAQLVHECIAPSTTLKTARDIARVLSFKPVLLLNNSTAGWKRVLGTQMEAGVCRCWSTRPALTIGRDL